MNRFSLWAPQTLLATVATVALLALSPAAGALAANGPDFSACPAQGQAHGQCVADIAQTLQDDQPTNDSAQATANSARDIVVGCQDNTERGDGLGECVETAVQALHDTGDEHAADVAATAHDLTDACQHVAGPAFGACVSAKAQDLGGAPQANTPAGAPQTTSTAGNPTNANAPGQRGPEGHPGNQAGQSGH